MKFPVNGVDAHTLAQEPPAHWVLYIPPEKRSPILQAAIDLAVATDTLKTFLSFSTNTDVSEVLDCTEEGYSSGVPFACMLTLLRSLTCFASKTSLHMFTSMIVLVLNMKQYNITLFCKPSDLV
jgi:mannose/fructose/N-acetylgalactosamine-specific phosphotransferase system component IIC